MPTPLRGETQEAFTSRCMADPEALTDFPDPDQRLAFCASRFDETQTAQATPPAVQFALAAAAKSAPARQEQFLGRPFLVIPAVLVRSQVLRNNLGVALLPPADITADWADLWNGIPVLIGDHPTQRGASISGRNPQLWDARGVGWVFNARAEDESPGIRRLVAEVWLDEARAGAVPGLQAVLDRVRNGQIVELSTGFGTHIEQLTGNFQGDPFEIVMHPLNADHLVVSADMTGACAVRDGCGLGANCNCGGHVEKPTEEKPTGVLARVAALVAEWRTPRKLTAEEYEARCLQREIEVWNELRPSDQERASMLRDQLQERFGATDRDVMLADVFSSEAEVMFWVQTPLGPQPKGSEFFRTTFTEADGRFTFTEPTRVRRTTKYEPVAGNATGEVPAGNAAGEEPAGVAAANATPKEEVTMSDNEKDGLAAQIAGLVAQVSALTTEVTAMKEAAARDPNPAIAGLKAQIGELVGAVENIRGVTASAVQERERERQALVKELAGHFRVPFTAAELEAKPMEELRKLRTMALGENYAGRGGPQGAPNTGEQRFMEPVPYWEKDKKEGGR